MSEYGVLTGLTERTEVQVSGAVAHAGFPAVVVADDGALVAIYRTATGHLSTDGEMVSRRSTDGGKTWGASVTVATSATRDYRDGNIVKLDNGDLLASIAARTNGGALINTGANVYRSTDNGQSWSALATEIGGGFAQWQYAAGPIWQLASGDLLLPVYGHASDSGGSNTNIGTLRSSDNGATWGTFVAITTGSNSYNEWSMVETSAGNLEGWVRHNGSTEWRKVTSTDDGATWGSPSTGLFAGVGGRPHLLLRGDNIWAVYRAEPEAGDPMRVCYKRVGHDVWQKGWRLNSPGGNKGSYGAIAFLADESPVVVYGDEASDTSGAVHAAVPALGMPAGPLSVTTSFLPNAQVGIPYAETLQASGGTPPYTWAITAGVLPSGLSLNPSTGEISGTPTTEESQTFTVQVADDESETDTQELTIVVDPVPVVQYLRTFPGKTNGDPIADEWTSRWAAPGTWEYRAEDPALYAVAGAIRASDSLSPTRRIQSFDPVGDEVGEVRVLALMRRNLGAGTGYLVMGVALRVSGASGSENGYQFMELSSGDIALRKLTGGASSVLATVASPASFGSLTWMRVEAVGSTLRMRVWQHGTEEPGTWNINETDSAHATGRIGLTTSMGTVMDFSVFSVGLDGAAPPQPIPAPLAPTVEASAVGSSIFASTSTMVAGDGGSGGHSGTRWQVRLATASDWTNPVVDLTTSEFLTAAFFEELSEETAYHVRAAHADGGIWGPFSGHVAVTTGTDIPSPDKPVVGSPVDEVGVDFVRATVSEFSHPEGTTTQEDFDPDNPLPFLLIVEWQVQLSGGDWSAPVFSEEIAVALLANPLEVLVSGLDDDTAHQIRARQRDGYYGAQSPWSDPVSFTTDAIPAERPDPPTVTLAACSWEGISVTSDAMTHPDGTAVHAASQWRACQASCSSTITTDPAKRQAFTWIFPPASVWSLSVRYRDDIGRWGDWSDPVTCTIDPEPPQVVVTSPVGGAVIDADTLIEWEAPYDPPTGAWVYTVEVSSDNGETWGELFSGTEPEYLFTVLGRVNGRYTIRVRACYEGGQCGDWFYLPLTLDRTGVSAVSYDFTAIEEFASSWEIFWDGFDEGVRWELVDRNLTPEGAPVGILARHFLHATGRESVLAFKELGQPRLGRFVTQFAVLGREDMWYFWRYAYAHTCMGGLGWSVTGTRPTQDRDGLLHVVSTGVQPWPCPTLACGCAFMDEGICLGCRSVTLDYQQADPATRYRYGTSYRPAGVSRLQIFDSATPFGTRINAEIPPTGRTQGMTVATRDEVPDDPENPEEGSTCIYRPIWYTMEQVVDRVGDDLRIRVKVFGPGLEPSGWHLTTTIRPADLPYNQGCGYCGLAIDQFRGLDQTIGILFRSFSAELPEGFMVNGPLYGTPTVEATP